MKKILLFVALCFSLSLLSQEVKNDTVVIEQYCELIGTGKMMSRKVTIEIDYGEFVKYHKDNRMRDEETGKLVKFNSMMDAVNYMAEDGWTLHSTMLISYQYGSVYHFIMKKSVKIFAESKP